MKKKIILTLIEIVLISSLCFAGAESELNQEESSLSSIEIAGTEILFWHQHSRSRGDVLTQLVTEFNESNEWDITILEEYAGGYDDIYNKMITGIAGNSLPGLVVAYQNQAAGYQVENALTDLTPYVEHPDYGIQDPEDFFEGFYKADVNSMFDGQRLGFPLNRSVEILYYNKSWLEKLGYNAPPSTWEQFSEMAAAATDERRGTYGYALRIDASNVYAMIISRGGEIAKADGTGYNLNSTETKESLILMKGLYDSGYAKKIAERYGDQTDFANQKVLFTMGSSSGLPYYASAIEAGESGQFEWSVAPFPHSTNKPKINVYGASVSVPKTTPEQQLAAWLFIRWFTEPEQQARWVEASNYFPVRKSVANNLGSYFSDNPNYEVAFNALKNSDTSAEPPFAGYDEVRDLISEAYAAVIDGKDIDDTLSQLEKDSNEVHEMSKP